MAYISKSNFAKKHGFTKPYVSELLHTGILKEEPNGMLNEEEADYALELKRLGSQQSRGNKSKLQELLIKVKLRNEIEKGKLLKLETAEKEKTLISVEEVQKIILEGNRVVRDAILNIPDRVAFLLASTSDPVKLHKILTKELRAALEGLSDGKLK